MKRYTIFVAGWLVIAPVPNDALADDGTNTLAPGASRDTADGPTSVQVRVNDCQFSIVLKKGEHIK